ncbi:hypothetical protein Tco_1484450 [Tanacetum coccineum]
MNFMKKLWDCQHDMYYVTEIVSGGESDGSAPEVIIPFANPYAIKFSKSSVDNINIAETERYPPDEYLHSYEPSQRYQTNSNDVSFIESYERPERVVLETEVSSDQNGHQPKWSST